MAQAKDFKVHTAAHTGITVPPLPEALEFWHDLLGLPITYQRSSLRFGDGENNIVGVPGSGANVALLAFPNGHQIEILEYTSPEDRETFAPRPCDVGNVHLAMEVEGSRALIQGAERLGWRPATSEPVRLQRGDASVWDMTYLRSPDGVTVELMERVAS